MTLSSIKKRNGQVVEFDPGHIIIAIQKATDSVENEIPTASIPELVDNIVSHLESVMGESVPSVETIQDLVEQELMRADFYKTERSYILYREKNKALREAELSRAAEKLEHNELKVISPD